ENRIPAIAAVRGFPHTAGHCSEIICIRLVGYARHREHASAAKRANKTPLHPTVGLGIDLLSIDVQRGCETTRREGGKQEELATHKHLQDRVQNVGWYHGARGSRSLWFCSIRVDQGQSAGVCASAP